MTRAPTTLGSERLAEARRLWSPALAWLLLWAARVAAPTGLMMRNLPLTGAAAYMAIASGIIYAKSLKGAKP